MVHPSSVTCLSHRRNLTRRLPFAFPAPPPRPLLLLPLLLPPPPPRWRTRFRKPRDLDVLEQRRERTSVTSPPGCFRTIRCAA